MYFDDLLIGGKENSMSGGVARFGLIGSGKMGSALVRGIIRSGLASASDVVASDVLPDAREKLLKELGIRVTNSNADVVTSSDVVLLAVYPQVVKQILPEIASLVTDRHLIVSIAAGITTRQIIDGLGAARRVARVMPNTPALIGAGAAAFCIAGTATDRDAQFIHNLLGVVGRAWQVEERHLDAVTGLSGSGPAYVFAIIEALSDGGVRMGLPRTIATALAAQTVFGSAKMLIDTGLHPGQLKDQVTSPGGTTIAGMHALERAGLRAALMNAVEAATQRSLELSKAP
jgi:pyrroline-5-carboxylate reductase